MQIPCPCQIPMWGLIGRELTTTHRCFFSACRRVFCNADRFYCSTRYMMKTRTSPEERSSAWNHSSHNICMSKLWWLTVWIELGGSGSIFPDYYNRASTGYLLQESEAAAGIGGELVASTCAGSFLLSLPITSIATWQSLSCSLDLALKGRRRYDDPPSTNKKL